MQEQRLVRITPSYYGEIGVSAYINEVTAPLAGTDHQAAAKAVIARAVEQNAHLDDYCQVSNLAGLELLKDDSEDQLPLFVSASECFRFAFVHEDPHTRVRFNYGTNLLQTVSYIVNQVPDLESIRGWLAHIKHPFRQALDTHIDFRQKFLYFGAFKNRYADDPRMKDLLHEWIDPTDPNLSGLVTKLFNDQAQYQSVWNQLAQLPNDLHRLDR